MTVTPASMTTDQVAFWRDHVQRHAVTTEQALSFLDAIDAEKAARTKAEAECDALRERLTLSDQELSDVAVMRDDAHVHLDDHLFAILAIIDRLTGEATDG